MLRTINYKGYTLKERKSICEEVGNYWSIYKHKGHGYYRWITVANRLEVAKMIVDERIQNYAD